MPETLEHRLKATARRRGYGKERTARYVYGTMRKTGWRPSHQKNISGMSIHTIESRPRREIHIGY